MYCYRRTRKRIATESMQGTARRPVALISAQSAPVPGRRFVPISSAWRNHLNTFFPPFFIRLVAVTRAVADQIARPGFDHVEVKAQLHRRDFVMVRRMRASGKREAVAVDNCRNFHTLTALRRPNLITAAFGRSKRRINQAFRFIQRTFIAKRVGTIGHDIAQHLVAAPLLETPMDGFVIWITLEQHAPLGACIEDPKDRFEDPAGGNRLAAGGPGIFSSAQCLRIRFLCTSLRHDMQ